MPPRQSSTNTKEGEGGTDRRRHRLAGRARGDDGDWDDRRQRHEGEDKHRRRCRRDRPLSFTVDMKQDDYSDNYSEDDNIRGYAHKKIS